MNIRELNIANLLWNTMYWIWNNYVEIHLSTTWNFSTLRKGRNNICYLGNEIPLEYNYKTYKNNALSYT